MLAISKNEAKYGTVGTPAKFWAVWIEKIDAEQELSEYVNISLSEKQVDKILSTRDWLVREEIASYGKLTRQVTEQDRTIYALCHPQRLLEIMFRFTLYDAGEKKIARYQQYFCVNKIIDRIRNIQKDGTRQGGVVWHTQGSGKSLTMVMLAEGIALEKGLDNYKIILVTDRVDLDDQIYKTFSHCGTEPVQAKTGKHLSDLIEVAAKNKKEIKSRSKTLDYIKGRI